MKDLKQMDISQLEKALRKLRKSENRFGKDSSRTEKINAFEKRLAELNSKKA